MQLVYQTIVWSKPRALPHFTNGHLFCYSSFLTASVPQKENYIFITLFFSMAQQRLLNLKKGTYRYGDWKTSNEIPHPAGSIILSMAELSTTE